MLGYAFLDTKSADALPQVPSSTTVSKQLYDFDNYCYNQDALDDLAKQILAQQGGAFGNNATFNNLISYTQGTAGRAGRPLVNKSITLKLGRFRYTEQSTSYNDLVWMPVYLSTNTSGEAILTLYLAATETHKGTSQQEQGYFTAQGLYTADYDIGGPSNSYGTSHMRSISLGAMRPYATYPGGSYRLKEDPSITQSNCNKFSDFIQGTGFKGALYDDIESPSGILWQAHETFADYSGDFVTSGFSTTYKDYCWPNEAYDTPTSGSNYYLPGYFDYAQKNRTQYDEWKNDKVWLPSLTEVGDGDLDPNGANTTNGVWGLTLSQRSNKKKSWLRTAKTDSPKSTDVYNNKYSTYTMFCIQEDGTIGEGDVSEICAIRPAIHLNLSKITGKTTPAVKLPELITSPYNGNPLGQTIDDIPADQRTWYDANDMEIAFYSDEACSRGVAPIDAGEYYMMVTLKGTSPKRFFGEDESTRYKSTKFVIEKIKLNVVWTYNEDATVKKVEFAPETQFFDRDLIPEVSFYYKSIMNSGDIYYEYPDVMGHYRAYAYIVDEDMYKYNYELSDDLRSNQFYVSERILPLPEFCYGPSDDISADHRSLTLPYKGKNFVQIKNISPTMIVTVSATPSSALDKVVDLGLNEDGVRTYIVENVARYTFNVALSDKDKANAKWESSTDVSKDIGDKQLVLSVNQAIITVAFDGVLSSWDTLTDMPFSLNIVGIQANDVVNMRVYYQPSRGGNQVDLRPDENGRYKIPKGLAVGEYTLAAVIAGDGQYTGPYQMNKAATQKFTITQAKSTFGPDLVSWQYTVNGQVTRLSDLGSGNTSGTAVELDFVNDYYQFTLQMEEGRLQQYYYVKATYSGATYVKDAGVYSITVTISAYDKNVSFETQTYTVHFRIKKASFDMSGVLWDYQSAFKHTGNDYEVLLKNVPDGLTVTYSGNVAKDIGSYTAQAVFNVSGDYANNYDAPEAMTLTWEIAANGVENGKIDYDTSSLVLRYTHGTDVKTATWNKQQKKWFDSEGNEFVLSFPYDGETYTLELSGSVPDLTIGTPSNNSYKNAGKYTADFNLSGNDDVYNQPEFGQIKWTIEKAEINFDNVRWGYIDNNGNEYENDFDNNPFVFTRDANGPVRFTVGLINLPEGMNINYSTSCLTKPNTAAVPGNSFSEAGDYQTSFNRTVSFNDPNYVSVSSIPTFIPSFQYWKIQERVFTEISYDGSWEEFDGRTHDLIELCGMPREELLYFRVEIAFLDGGNNLDNYYEGYDGVEYAAYHAGTYIIRFFELRGDAETEYFWGSIEIEVGKANLEITWDTKGSIYVARVTGLYVTEMIGTRYTTESGDEVKVEYIKATDGVKFFAEPYIMKEYSNDLQIVMAPNQKEKIEFVYWRYTSTPGVSHEVDKSQIKFRYDSLEFTGEPITFELLYWDMDFAAYLYYEGDSLTQTEVGKYSIDISFIKYDSNTGAGDAYWKGTDDDRSSLTLNFEITKPTSSALDYPRLEKNSVAYDGNIHKINITNLAALNEYVTYEVTFEGRNFGQQLSFREAGNYTISFTLIPEKGGYWKEDPSNPNKVYTLTFRIIDPSTSTPLALPHLVTDSMKATGQELKFEIADWDSYYSGYCEITSGSLTQTAVGTYTVTVTIKDEFGDLKFSNGARSYVLTFNVTEGDKPVDPDKIPLPILLAETKEYTGYEISFISNWSEMSEHIIIVDENGSQSGTLLGHVRKEVGEYTIYLRIKDESKRKGILWADGTDGDIMLKFRIIPATVDTDNITADSDGSLKGPNGMGDDVNLDDFLDYEYFDKDGNPVSKEDLKDGEEYNVTIKWKPELSDPDSDLYKKFYESFVNADAIKKFLTENNSFTFTYDSGSKDNKLLIIITIAEVVVLVFLIIATIIVLAIQHKIYDTEEDEYDNYEDYEEDDEY